MSSPLRKIQKRLFREMGYPRPYRLVKTFAYGQEMQIPEYLPWPSCFPVGTLDALRDARIVKNDD